VGENTLSWHQNSKLQLYMIPPPPNINTNFLLTQSEAPRLLSHANTGAALYSVLTNQHSFIHSTNFSRFIEPNVHCRIYNSISGDPDYSNAHAPTIYFQIYFDTFVHSVPRSKRSLLHSTFVINISYAFLVSPGPSHSRSDSYEAPRFVFVSISCRYSHQPLKD
jgi:hypothetical protein